MIQSTLMGRAEILQSCRYRSEYPVCEDLDMYIRLTRSHRIANLPFIAVDRRLHPNQVTETRAATSPSDVIRCVATSASPAP